MAVELGDAPLDSEAVGLAVLCTQPLPFARSVHRSILLFQLTNTVSQKSNKLPLFVATATSVIPTGIELAQQTRDPDDSPLR